MPEKFLDHKDFSGNQALNLALQILAGDHSNPQKAIVWFNDSEGRAGIFDGDGVRYFAYSDETGEADGGNADTLGGQSGAYYLSRDNHTGTQTAETISDFDSAVALLTSAFVTDADVENRIAALIDGAPAALDTLREIAEVLGENESALDDLIALVNQRARMFAASVGDGSTLAHTVTHGFSTRDVMVECYFTSSPFGRAWPTVEATTLNAVTIRTAQPLAANSLRVVVTGAPIAEG